MPSLNCSRCAKKGRGWGGHHVYVIDLAPAVTTRRRFAARTRSDLDGRSFAYAGETARRVQCCGKQYASAQSRKQFGSACCDEDGLERLTVYRRNRRSKYVLEFRIGLRAEAFAHRNRLSSQGGGKDAE